MSRDGSYGDNFAVVNISANSSKTRPYFRLILDGAIAFTQSGEPLAHTTLDCKLVDARKVFSFESPSEWRV
ncbi:hypothetical protein [Nostoc sp. FACHB-280]|uniref:hypothetical protein n=1 Tax=Nostoc sp. FACHB-280 TaxID=2692839 RepID=UPI00168A7440|nr:hypothetical protein [Nostoc sp. FACHB-280]MBD2497270.1 hypothetical protein [Nostoc sp. FACHB-280]